MLPPPPKTAPPHPSSNIHPSPSTLHPKERLLTPPPPLPSLSPLTNTTSYPPAVASLLPHPKELSPPSCYHQQEIERIRTQTHTHLWCAGSCCCGQLLLELPPQLGGLILPACVPQVLQQCVSETQQCVCVCSNSCLQQCVYNSVCNTIWWQQCMATVRVATAFAMRLRCAGCGVLIPRVRLPTAAVAAAVGVTTAATAAATCRSLSSLA